MDMQTPASPTADSTVALPTPPAAHPDRQALPNLDGLRGLACLLVVLTHIPTAFRIPALGDTGVAIFFTLSGFLMGYLYGDRPWTFASTARYAIARFSRIAPIYWAVILFSIAMTALDAGFYPQIEGTTQILRHLAFSGSISVYWSIPPEVQYYLLFIVLWGGWALRHKHPAWLVTLALACSIVVLLQAHWPGISVLHKLHFFLLGTLAGLAPRPDLARQRGFAWLQAGALAALTLPLFVVHQQSALYQIIPVAGLVAAALYLLSFSTRWTSLIFAAPLMRAIGRGSFSIYLMHMIVIHAGARLLGIPHDVFSPALALLGLLGIVIPMGISRYVEIPLQHWTRKRLTSALARFEAHPRHDHAQALPAPTTTTSR